MTEEMKAAMERTEAAVMALREANARKFEEFEARLNRQALGSGGGGEGESEAKVRKAFETFVRTGDASEVKALVLSSGPAGGYLVPTSLAAQIIEVGAEEGAIRRLARTERLTEGVFEQPIAKNLCGAVHVAEGSSRSETSTPDFAVFRSAGGGLAAVAPISNWALQDAQYDVAAFITVSIGMQFGIAEAQDFIVGDGVGKSRGFTTYPLAATADATRPWGTIEKVAAGSVSDFDIDDLLDLRGRLGARYRRGASWIMHPDVETYIRKLKSATTGEYYWQPSVAAGTPPTLLGLACHVDPFMPVISSGAAVVALADWKKAYLIIDIGSPMVIRDEVTSKGRTLVYCEKRLDAGVLDFNAVKILTMEV